MILLYGSFRQLFNESYLPDRLGHAEPSESREDANASNSELGLQSNFLLWRKHSRAHDAVTLRNESTDEEGRWQATFEVMLQEIKVQLLETDEEHNLHYFYHYYHERRLPLPRIVPLPVVPSRPRRP